MTLITGKRGLIMELPAQRIDKVKRMNRNNNIHTKRRENGSTRSTCSGQASSPSRAESREGFVLVLTVFTSVILATLIIGFLNMTAIDLNLFKNHMCSLQAYYIAEAGIADAIDKIQQGTSTTTPWEEDFPAAPDKYSVSVTQGSTTVINSTGLASASNFSRVLEVTVNVTGSSAPYKVRINKWEEKIAQ